MNEVTITLEKYDELKYKEFVFETVKTELARDIAKGNYVSESDRVRYGLEYKPETECLEALRARLAKEKQIYTAE